MKPTHILVNYRSQKSSMLFRAEDGILICMQQKAVCVFGDSPKDKNSHTFIDEPAAAKWLKDVYPFRDMKERAALRGILLEENIDPAILEERDGEGHGLYVPEDTLELPGFGPGMRKTN